MPSLSDTNDYSYVNMDLIWYVSFHTHSTILKALLWLSHIPYEGYAPFNQDKALDRSIFLVTEKLKIFVDVIADTINNTTIGSTAFCSRFTPT